MSKRCEEGGTDKEGRKMVVVKLGNEGQKEKIMEGKKNKG